jgi:hypothetical protein
MTERRTSHRSRDCRTKQGTHKHHWLCVLCLPNLRDSSRSVIGPCPFGARRTFQRCRYTGSYDLRVSPARLAPSRQLAPSVSALKRSLPRIPWRGSAICFYSTPHYSKSQQLGAKKHPSHSSVAREGAVVFRESGGFRSTPKQVCAQRRRDRLPGRAQADAVSPYRPPPAHPNKSPGQSHQDGWPPSWLSRCVLAHI